MSEIWQKIPTPLLWSSPNEKLKEDTIFFRVNMEEVMPQFSSLRDLGVIMSDNEKFEDHIKKVSRVIRQKIWWMMGTFCKRRAKILKQFWKTLFQCHIDYRSQLYMPSQAGNWTAFFPSFFLPIYQQSRKILYYLCMEDLRRKINNSGVELAAENVRLGRKCQIPKLRKKG